MFSLLFAGKKGLVEALVVFVVFFKVIKASSYRDVKRKSLFLRLFLFVMKNLRVVNCVLRFGVLHL